MRKNISIGKLLFLVCIVAFTFSSVVAVQSNNGIKSEVLTNPSSQKISPGNTISSQNTNIVSPTVGQGAPGKSAEQFAPPYSVEVYIDGVQISLHEFAWYDQAGVLVGYPVHWWTFYHIFAPGYFSIGTHTLREVFHWYNGYGWWVYNGQTLFRQQTTYDTGITTFTVV